VGGKAAAGAAAACSSRAHLCCTRPPLHTPQLASAGSGLDVAKVAEAQPGLLLLQGQVWDDLGALKEQLTVSRVTGDAVFHKGEGCCGTRTCEAADHCSISPLLNQTTAQSNSFRPSSHPLFP